MQRNQLCEDPWKKEEQMPDRVNLMLLRDMRQVFVAGMY